MIEFSVQKCKGQQVAVYAIVDSHGAGTSAPFVERARRHGVNLELWDLREADLTGWDYHTARDNVERWREHYSPGVRVAVLVRSRSNYLVAFAVKAVAETEQLNVVFDVFVEEDEALAWLVSDKPPVVSTTIPAPSSGKRGD